MGQTIAASCLCIILVCSSLYSLSQVFSGQTLVGSSPNTFNYTLNDGTNEEISSEVWDELLENIDWSA